MPKNNVYKFRAVKWGDPERKLKMIADSVPAEMRLLYFALLAAGLCVCVLAFGITYGLRAVLG